MRNGIGVSGTGEGWYRCQLCRCEILQVCDGTGVMVVQVCCFVHLSSLGAFIYVCYYYFVLFFRKASILRSPPTGSVWKS